jgi:ABC-type sugar transport system ATPase subunit
MTPAAALDRPHDSVVSLNGIWKSFGGLSVLKDVSIELRRGEVHVLLGENGAGKSTLVNVMIGAHAPDRGEVRLHAKPVDDLNPFVARQLGINAVMQDFSLAPAMTVAENYFLGREETRGPFMRKGEMRAAAHAAIQSLGVAIDVDTPVSDLSRPEQQLLEIIRALGGRPGALILDEPTATLSHDESEILFSTLDRLRRGGWAVLYITHRLNEVHRLADRITILRDGSVVAQYPAGQVSDERLIRDMVGRSLETFYPAVQSQAGDVALALVGVSDKNGRISDVTLNVRYGEIVGIGGLVGCGKGEIGSIVFGLDALKAGRLELDGQPRRFSGPRDALQHGIVYLPQDRRGEALALNRSADENMTIERIRSGEGAAWGFLKTGSLSNFVRSMISMLDIRPPDPEKPAQDFSGGNQQKLVLGRALSRPRKIFILCEPTAGIDVGARLDFYQQMERLCQQGAAIVLISSDLQELIHLSHRIYVMHRGRVVGELSGDRRTEDEVTRYAFGG